MADETTLALSAIEQIAVNAHDLERAVDFYRDKLGMKHLVHRAAESGFL